MEKPQDPITERKAQSSDYGALNLFTQFLVDRYGKEVLVDSLHSSKSGVDSLNYALQKKGSSKNSQESLFILIYLFIGLNDP